jgi:hypothetical protein
MKQIGFTLVACIAACGDGKSVSSDAGPDIETDAGPDAAPVPTECWPDGVRMPTGSATLGTGRDAFQAMPEVLPLEYGFQDGFMFIANVRMSGFAPGDTKDILSPHNPRTQIRAFFADTNVPLNRASNCPFRVGYQDIGNGEYELIQSQGIVFETCWRADRLIGKQFRIELALMDAWGDTYATDTQIVTAGEPLDPGYPHDQGSLPCPQ